MRERVHGVGEVEVLDVVEHVQLVVPAQRHVSGPGRLAGVRRQVQAGQWVQRWRGQGGGSGEGERGGGRLVKKNQ